MKPVVAAAIAALLVGLPPAFTTGAHAQDFPQGPVTIVVPYPAGGATDIVARLVQPKLSELLGQTVVIENRPGASGNTATAAVLRGKPDGQTIVLTTNAVMTFNPHLYSDLGFDPLTQAAPITRTSESGLVLAIHPSIPANNLQEFIEYAAKNPGKVTLGTGGAPMQIIGEMIGKRGNVQIQNIPYKGAAPAINDAVGGHINAVIMQIASITPFIQSQKLRPLAVSTAQPIKTMPDVPTLTSTFPGIEGTNWYGFFAPAGTPKPVIEKLNVAIVSALKDPAVVDRLDKAGEQIVAGTPEELSQKVRADYARWADFVKTFPRAQGAVDRSMPDAVLPDGGRLAYDVHDFTDPWSDAEPLIFVHGFSKNRKFWYEWLPEFARDYRVYNLDMRGHGGSSAIDPDFRMSLSAFARDIVDFMDVVNIRSAHFIMAEFASAIAIELAADFPERVRSVTMPGFGYNWRAGTVSAKAWADLLREKGTAAWAEETNTHRLPADADPALRKWYIAQQSKMPVELMIKLFDYSVDLDQTDRLPLFKAPALIMSGTNAQQATADSARRATELMPNCTAVIMEGMPFNVMTACPQACIAATRDFLKSLRPA